MAEQLRSLPSVERLLQTEAARGWTAQFGRSLTLKAIREALEAERETLLRSGDARAPTEAALLASVQTRLHALSSPSLRPLINATGVILHTNLGRAPLSRAAIGALETIARGYSNLEYDLPRGARGTRTSHAEDFLCQLTGAQAALVVNNNAAAVLLCLTALANRKQVVIARSQLMEVGGGFRIPDVLRQSGAKLVEVGATNRVYRSDYETALEAGAALILRAHPSNYRVVGFTAEPQPAELAQLARQYAIPLVDDLGSGVLLDTARYGLAHEPTVQEALAYGADLVTFSGDKLLGGPQAGIIVGRADYISKLKRHPLARAVRADKLCLAALSVTLLHYLKEEAEQEIPIWQMISAAPEAVRQRAEAWRRALQVGRVVTGFSTVGGGSLPGETLATFLLELPDPRPNRLLERLRRAAVPVIARVQENRVVLDPRTVLPDEEQALIETLQSLTTGAEG